MEDSPSEIMSVPKPRREVGCACMSLVVVLFLIFMPLVIICMSIVSWSHGFESIASLPLLAFVGYIIYKKCEDGWRPFLVDIAGEFTTKHFAELVRGHNDPPSIRFGFSFLGRRQFYTSIPLAAITKVSWGPGQASGLAGRDMDDWNIALWFSPVEAATPKARFPVYVVGSGRPKDLTADLGREFLVLLERGGTTFTKGQNDCTFVRESAGNVGH